MAKKPKTAAASGDHPDTFIIEGEGTVPVIIEGELRRLARGKSITLTGDEQAALDAADVSYSRG